MLTVFVHSHLETLLEAARLTLVPVCLVHDAQTCASLASGYDGMEMEVVTEYVKISNKERIR